MTSYKTYLNNLTESINNLPDTQIKFLFFLKSDLVNAKVKTRFKRCRVDNTVWYISEAQSNNYWYIYRESTLKYMTSPPKPSKSPLYNDINSFNKDQSGDTNHGDHIDFSMKKQKLYSTPLILTHFTQYDEDVNLMFTRFAPEFDGHQEYFNMVKSMDTLLKSNPVLVF